MENRTDLRLAGKFPPSGRPLRTQLQHLSRLFPPGLPYHYSQTLVKPLLVHLHSHGLIHKGITASDVAFFQGRPKIADIGLSPEATGYHDTLVTAAYIVPDGRGTPAGDLFALGKVLYECLTGFARHEFPEFPSEIRQWRDAKLALKLKSVILKLCSFVAGERYSGAEPLLADLKQLDDATRRR